MEKDSFIFYRSFFEATKPLNSEQKAELFNAICEFALNQTETKTEPIVNAMFTLIKPQLLANNKRYENGKKGGRPKQKNNQTITKTKPKDNQTITKTKPNVNDNVNVNENNNDNENEKVKELLEKVSKTLSDKIIEFFDYRKEIKKPLKSEKSKIKIIQQIIKEREDVAIKTIDNSIMNGWQGLFFDKEKNSAKKERPDLANLNKDDFDYSRIKTF